MLLCLPSACLCTSSAGSSPPPTSQYCSIPRGLCSRPPPITTVNSPSPVSLLVLALLLPLPNTPDASTCVSLGSQTHCVPSHIPALSPSTCFLLGFSIWADGGFALVVARLESLGPSLSPLLTTHVQLSANPFGFPVRIPGFGPVVIPCISFTLSCHHLLSYFPL